MLLPSALTVTTATTRMRVHLTVITAHRGLAAVSLLVPAPGTVAATTVTAAAGAMDTVAGMATVAA
jgi:hypothetical protein